MAYKLLTSSLVTDRRTQRGFTLTELMAAVVIVAILATVAVYGVGRYIKASRTAEVTAVINAIRAGQEAYREETFTYLEVSVDYSETYPADAPQGLTRYAWGDTTTDVGKRFAALGVQPSGPVIFGYSCVAGGPGSQVNAPPEADDSWPEIAAEPYYVVRAIGDQDGDGNHSAFVASSFTDTIQSVNATE